MPVCSTMIVMTKCIRKLQQKTKRLSKVAMSNLVEKVNLKMVTKRDCSSTLLPRNLVKVVKLRSLKTGRMMISVRVEQDKPQIKRKQHKLREERMRTKFLVNASAEDQLTMLQTFSNKRQSKRYHLMIQVPRLRRMDTSPWTVMILL